jgi:hypothetical protein
MRRNKFLREHADSLARFAKETARRARAAPDDFFLQLAAKNQEQSSKAVQRQLMSEETEKSGELAELEPIGLRASAG